MKDVRKTAAIALGIICIILVVSEAYAIADYTTIDSLNSQISLLNSQITNLQAQITSLNTHISNLNDTVNLANSTVLVNSYTLSQPASYCSYMNFTASYAGYVSVNVKSSTTNNTYVGVVYFSHGVNYNNLIVVGTGGIAVFPILPASIQVGVGNTNSFNNATETVTITYYY